MNATPSGPRAPSSLRLVALWVVAFGVHLAADALASGLSVRPPHLMLDRAPEVFQDLLSPAGVAIAAGAVNGLIAVICALALEGSGRRPWIRLALVLTASWALSEGLLAIVWLSAPAGAVVLGLAAGLPRTCALAFLLERVQRGSAGAIPHATA